MSRFLDFLIYFFMLALMWVGAEYIFEGAVHTSAVDTFFCAALARTILKYGEVTHDQA